MWERWRRHRVHQIQITWSSTKEKLHISLLEVSTWGERRRRAAALQEVDWRGRNFLMWIKNERSDGSSKRELWVVVMMEFKSQIFMLWISWRFIDHIKFSHIAPNESFNDAPSSLNTVTKNKYICYSSLFFSEIHHSRGGKLAIMLLNWVGVSLNAQQPVQLGSISSQRDSSRLMIICVRYICDYMAAANRTRPITVGQRTTKK